MYEWREIMSKNEETHEGLEGEPRHWVKKMKGWWNNEETSFRSKLNWRKDRMRKCTYQPIIKLYREFKSAIDYDTD